MFTIDTVCAGLSGGTAGEGLLITKPGHSTMDFSNFWFSTEWLQTENRRFICDVKNQTELQQV